MRTTLGLCCFSLLLVASPATADVIIGPGNVAGEWHDGAFDIIAVDLNNPVTLGPGSYIASQFNHEFTAAVVGGGPATALTGSITPLLLIGGGTNFTPVAVGDTIPFTGPTPGFVSVPFGGADSFTLAAPAVVYPGLYWETTEQGLDERMPVGFVNFTGNVFVVFGGGFGPGANPPAVGTPINGSAQDFFQRIYDFSIEVNPDVAAVPEPGTFVIGLIGGAGLLGWGLLRRLVRA